MNELLDALAAEEAVVLGRSLDDEDRPYARARLWEEDPVREALDELWPFLTPQQLLAGLFGEEVPCAGPLRVFLPPNGPCCSVPRRGTRPRRTPNGPRPPCAG